MCGGCCYGWMCEEIELVEMVVYGDDDDVLFGELCVVICWYWCVVNDVCIIVNLDYDG